MEDKEDGCSKKREGHDGSSIALASNAQISSFCPKNDKCFSVNLKSYLMMSFTVFTKLFKGFCLNAYCQEDMPPALSTLQIQWLHSSHSLSQMICNAFPS